MTKKILLAIRPQETEFFCSAIRKSAHMPIRAGSLSEARAHLAEIQFQIAVIDEDFDGPGMGWMLAESIRQHFTSNVKIIMLVRRRPQDYFRNDMFEGKCDWIMSFPISEEQLLHELNRKWPTVD